MEPFLKVYGQSDPFKGISSNGEFRGALGARDNMFMAEHPLGFGLNLRTREIVPSSFLQTASYRLSFLEYYVCTYGHVTKWMDGIIMMG